jgi:hypothetical protein
MQLSDIGGLAMRRVIVTLLVVPALIALWQSFPEEQRLVEAQEISAHPNSLSKKIQDAGPWFDLLSSLELYVALMGSHEKQLTELLDQPPKAAPKLLTDLKALKESGAARRLLEETSRLKQRLKRDGHSHFRLGLLCIHVQDSTIRKDQISEGVLEESDLYRRLGAEVPAMARLAALSDNDHRLCVPVLITESAPGKGNRKPVVIRFLISFLSVQSGEGRVNNLDFSLYLDDLKPIFYNWQIGAENKK